MSLSYPLCSLYLALEFYLCVFLVVVIESCNAYWNIKWILELNITVFFSLFVNKDLTFDQPIIKFF